ncbi:hypothetical protein H4P12_01695 [Paracoccus sp. 11-3]|uniref:Uncharacterized protein n=1 Tax=Paracoccus amoyensis TaxID=2760093 RepID=A0A926GK23_9RHOB|nr:hypothetical protein [Paracoccus amoyensis]MBC9245450.1 hypothetical protein [Paracoccus amoyensis]
MNADKSRNIENAIARILIWNTAIAGIIATIVICSFTGFAIAGILKGDSEAVQKNIPTELSNWGGVIIGFYFGSALTQAGALISAIKGSGKTITDEGQSNSNPPIA